VKEPRGDFKGRGLSEFGVKEPRGDFKGTGLSELVG